MKFDDDVYGRRLLSSLFADYGLVNGRPTVELMLDNFSARTNVSAWNSLPESDHPVSFRTISKIKF